ncbi:MAG: hypothetical protein L3K07_08725 [Thermoplasmata archaeon]|nr:hypothetical protein [Thermoplasmata archaeon]
MGGLSSAESTAILVQLVIVLLIIRRSYAMTQGVGYSALILGVVPVLLLVLWGVTELESTLLTPWALPYLVAADLAILLVTAFLFTPVAERMTTVTRDATGVGSFRIGFSFAALFVGVFVVRFAVAIALFPASFEFGRPPGGYPPAGQQLVVAAIDALFSMSVGLLIARSLGIRRKWASSRAPPAAHSTT